MNHMNILALIQAGQVKEEDDYLPPMIQNIDPADARTIAKWLALATTQVARLRLIGPGGSEEIECTPAQLLADIERARQRAKEAHDEGAARDEK